MGVVARDLPGGPSPIAACSEQQHMDHQPASSSAAKQVGDAAFGRGAFDQAAAAYTAALLGLSGAEDEPHLRGVLLANRCLARLRLGAQAASALADAQEACRLRPRWGKAHLRLAQVGRRAEPQPGSQRVQVQAANLAAWHSLASNLLFAGPGKLREDGGSGIQLPARCGA